MLLRVVLAAASPELRRRLEDLLRAREVGTVESLPPGELRSRLDSGDVDLVVASRSALPEPAPGFVREVRHLEGAPEVLVVGEREDPEERARLVAAGCVAVLYEGLSDRTLADTLGTLIERLRRETFRRIRDERTGWTGTLDDFVSESPAMREFLSMARRVVASSSSLLVLGETGVGKERLARSIHAEGPRAAGPFMAVNCGALPEGLLESELFGHEQGAFTGATRARRGYFELAHGGTLFLDEIGEIPLHLQVKLLRVLEERRFQRVGGERPVHVDVRVVAATNRDLEQMTREGRFRQDLYYRLAVVTLVLPPLRERREDIPQLVESYFDHFRRLIGRPLEGLQPEAMEALTRYHWPGNVRELINVIERAVLLAAGPEIGLADLPRTVTGATAAQTRAVSSAPLPDIAIDRPLATARREAIDAFEHAYLRALLRQTGGHIGRTADRAGINERSLYDLMRRHGLRKEDFKAR